jgi:hypothetical protein
LPTVDADSWLTRVEVTSTDVVENLVTAGSVLVTDTSLLVVKVERSVIVET